MKGLVSILIPAFNAQPFIADAIQSALSQTWPRTEIIIVDDESTDMTLQIARGFASRNVLVVTQPNQGASAARNRAYALSQGDYIQWFDADDLLGPDKIAKQIEALDQAANNRTLVSCSWGRFLHRPCRARFEPSPLWCDLSPLEWQLRKMEHGAYMQTGVWLVPRELAEATGPWDTRLSLDDDGEYFSRMLLASDGTRFVPDAKVFYRSTGASSLSYVGRSPAKLQSLLLSCRLQVGYVQSLCQSPRSKAACLKYLQKYFSYFYLESPELERQLQQLAAELGGELHPPELSWKYGWIGGLFGWNAAKRCRIWYNKRKWSFLRRWDKVMLKVQNSVSRS